jgi:transitional endoplasmic reticulum ATPase
VTADTEVTVRDAAAGDGDAIPLRNVYPEDVGGLTRERAALADAVRVLRGDDLFERLGRQPATGVLLGGPAGVGKTRLVHALVNETGATFVPLDAIRLAELGGDRADERLSDAAERARRGAPALVHVADLDAVAPEDGSESQRRLVVRLGRFLDELADAPGAIVVGEARRLGGVAAALRRGGRFDREVEFRAPSREERRELLGIHVRGLALGDDVDLDELAGRTHGFVGADVASLVRAGVSAAARRLDAGGPDDVPGGGPGIAGAGAGASGPGARPDANASDGRDRSGDPTPTSARARARSAGLGDGDAGLGDDDGGGDGGVGEPVPDGADDGRSDADGPRVRMVDFRTALEEVEPSAMRDAAVEVPDVTWDDVGGLAAAKRELVRSVEWPLTHPELFAGAGISPPQGILLYGPPGTGKTLLARAVANATDANFISVKGPELLNKYVGESERAVREVFERARQNAPAVVFFDEIDAVSPERSDDDSGAPERVVSQLLTELDGIEGLESVTVIGATNRPDRIDAALLRPGRLERIVEVPLPDESARESIFRVHTRSMPLRGIDPVDLAARTEGYSGSDIEAVVREAGMLAVEDALGRDGAADGIVVTADHFDRALAASEPSITPEQRDYYRDLADRGVR